MSGAIAAMAAAQEGISVEIFEEHSDIGEPSHCSGHVGIQAFRRFAPAIPERIIENEIKGAVLYSPNGQSLILHRREPVTWVLNRAELDRHLASAATKSGAKLNLKSRVESLRRHDAGFGLRISGPDRSEITCRMVIEAGGCGASVSKYTGPTQATNGILVNSAQFNVGNLHDIDRDFVEVYFGQNYAPGFFGWIIPRRDGTAKVGIAAGARTNVRECLKRFTSKHPVVSEKLKHSKPLTAPIYHPIPVGGATRRTYADGILTVGDAASQVKPTTGGGIVFGLACGRLAGKTAAITIRTGDTSATSLASYERAWRQLIGFDLRAMSWLRRLMYRLPDQHLDRIFKVSADLKADEILDRTSDIDFQGRGLLSLARDPRLFITLLSASLLSVPSLLAQEVRARRRS